MSLEVWKLAKELSRVVYKITGSFPGEEKFGLVSQLRRASVSIATNVAEGTGRITKKDKVHFTQIAYGSLMEVLNLLIISNELTYINDEELLTIREKIE